MLWLNLKIWQREWIWSNVVHIPAAWTWSNYHSELGPTKLGLTWAAIHISWVDLGLQISPKTMPKALMGHKVAIQLSTNKSRGWGSEFNSPTPVYAKLFHCLFQKKKTFPLFGGNKKSSMIQMISSEHVRLLLHKVLFPSHYLTKANSSWYKTSFAENIWKM